MKLVSLLEETIVASNTIHLERERGKPYQDGAGTKR
jgi:hypothetical protein